MAERILPDYDNPPAQETWMAFAFAPLKWSIRILVHSGAKSAPIIPGLRCTRRSGEVSFEFSGKGPEAIVNLPVRCWLINDVSNRLIQVQSNFFCHNWRRPSIQLRRTCTTQKS